MSGKKILVTGAAGFIGFHLVEKLIGEGHKVIGLDNINDYYDVDLKYARLLESGIEKEEIKWDELTNSGKHSSYKFIRANLENKEGLFKLFEQNGFDIVVNLAAQAGVRYSIENPDVYVSSNINGFYNLLEACRNYPVEHLVFASSSSVYGDSDQVPFKENSMVNKPISLYAATKLSGELMAYTYCHLYKIPTTGLRFFTVYGPWGRPDMAISLFTDKIIKGETIQVFNNGELSRDFTYVDDIVEGVSQVINKSPEKRDESPNFKLFNIGNTQSVKLLEFIYAIEKATCKKAKMKLVPMQPGDVHKTWADVGKLISEYNFKPMTTIESGINQFVNWYRSYKGLID